MQELIILFLIAFTILATLLLKSSFSYDSVVSTPMPVKFETNLENSDLS